MIPERDVYKRQRFGFSDIIPTLLAMNASLRFYRGGVKRLWAYMNEDAPERDILLEIVLPKEGRRTKVQMMRLSYKMCIRDRQKIRYGITSK